VTIRVLVVDDTDHVREMLVEMLSLDGFEVVGSAADGPTGVELAVRTDPHVVVMDLRLRAPLGIDGLETTRQLRERRPCQHVILYTAYLDAAIEAQARAAGVALCLGKMEGIPQLERELSRLALELAQEAAPPGQRSPIGSLVGREVIPRSTGARGRPVNRKAVRSRRADGLGSADSGRAAGTGSRPRRRRRRRRDPDGVSAVLAGAASAAAAEVEASLRVTGDPAVAAFFDVDNTMMQGASIYHFAKGLASRKFFTWRDLAHFGWQQMRFRLQGESEGSMTEAREAALAFVAGHKVAEVVALGEEIYDEMMESRIWSGSQALAGQHLDNGERVWLVTATPVELARIISSRLGLTGALGTVSEVEDGVYTGRLVGEPLHGPAKAEAIRALAEREGLDLSRCTAYSDSANDLPMLELVGNPVAVNPDADLRRAAQERDWTIRDYRIARKAAKVGLPPAAALVAGGVAAGVVLRRRREQRLAARMAAAVRPGRPFRPRPAAAGRAVVRRVRAR